jgi:hypothetical protein
VRYADDRRALTSAEARIFIPLELEPISRRVVALVDTAAPWCIFEPALGFLLRPHISPVQDRVLLSTRLGTLTGALYRVPVKLPADEGEPLQMEATVFLSPDWQGPNFIGYEGLLQRIRFAVDPEANQFYFGGV